MVRTAEVEAKEKTISDLAEELKQTQERYDQYVQDKETEMSNIKSEFELELEKNNEFVLNQINILKQELAETRLVHLTPNSLFVYEPRSKQLKVSWLNTTWKKNKENKLDRDVTTIFRIRFLSMH